MRLKSIELKLFKPLMHNGTRHIKIDELPNIVVISGENGSGKSSLLRECTPYPACRSDYEKDGYKKVIYEHSGSIYVLTSDFSKIQGAHSFVKDGTELNESGTAEVQSDLVETFFSYNDVIEKLVSGKYKMCDMGKPDRKTLIMSTYPSSLSFMLDYHKDVSSKLRAIGNNIKMLRQRETSLKELLISPAILSDYKRERDDLNKAISKIDLDVYAINKGINDTNNILNTVSYGILEQTPESFIGKITNIENRLKGILRSNHQLPKSDEIKIIIDRLNNMRASLDAKIKDDSSAAMSIKEEIDQYSKYLNTDMNSNIAECKNAIDVQTAIINNTPIDSSIPFITRSEFENLQNNAPAIQEILLTLKSSTVPFWTEDKYHSVEIQINDLQQSIRRYASELAGLDESIRMLEIKKIKYSKNSWPTDCVRVCPLRSSFSDILNNIEQQLSQYKKDRDTKSEAQAQATLAADELKKSIEQRYADRSVLANLNKYLLTISWGNWALSDKSLIDALNSDITKIYNNITKLLANSKNALKVKEATDLKVALEAKLTKLENNSAPAEQLIKDSLVKREIQLNEIVARINENKLKVVDIEKKNFNNNLYANLIAEAECIKSDYQIWKKVYTLQQEIKQFRLLVDELMNSRAKIMTKLRELDNVITEQDGYSIRLNDEVLINLSKLTTEYNELAVIEAQLSPTKGIPHLYTVKYINSIFKLANTFIKRTWCYEMELAYLSEQEDVFDYSFKLLLNGNSEIKDINMCSNGQRSMINLAIRLAICIFRQYALNYPIQLDEISDGLSIQHASNLVLFLSELLQQDNQIGQIFIVDHNISISSSFASIAKMINLSKDTDVGEEWQTIGTIE